MTGCGRRHACEAEHLNSYIHISWLKVEVVFIRTFIRVSWLSRRAGVYLRPRQTIVDVLQLEDSSSSRIPDSIEGSLRFGC